GIGAREVRRPAIWAASHPTRRRHIGRRSALSAEAMSGVPVEQGAGLGENGRLAGGDGRSEGAHVDQLGVDVGGDVRPGRIDREMRAPVAKAEKDQRRARVDLVAPLAHRLPIERRRRRAASERLQVAQRQYARLRVAEQRGDPRAVISAFAAPIQRITAETVDVLQVGIGGGALPHWSNLTDRPVAEERSIASISLWRWTARSKS